MKKKFMECIFAKENVVRCKINSIQGSYINES